MKKMSENFNIMKIKYKYSKKCKTKSWIRVKELIFTKTKNIFRVKNMALKPKQQSCIYGYFLFFFWWQHRIASYFIFYLSLIYFLAIWFTNEVILFWKQGSVPTQKENCTRVLCQLRSRERQDDTFPAHTNCITVVINIPHHPAMEGEPE